MILWNVRSASRLLSNELGVFITLSLYLLSWSHNGLHLGILSLLFFIFTTYYCCVLGYDCILGCRLGIVCCGFSGILDFGLSAVHCVFGCLLRACLILAPIHLFPSFNWMVSSYISVTFSGLMPTTPAFYFFSATLLFDFSSVVC